MRRSFFASSMLLAMLCVLTGAASAPARAATTLMVTTPRHVIAHPGVGTVTVSWSALRLTGVTYSVASTPAGLSCTVVDKMSCTIPVTTSAPWQFSVTASNSSGSSLPSAPTKPFKHRTLLIVVGQSNALGAESYAKDPVTGINYLARHYGTRADVVDKIFWPAGWLSPMPGPSAVNLDTPQICVLCNSPSVQTFGPEIGLARQVWADTGTPVTIVKETWAVTSLAVDWNPSTPGDIYSQMVASVKSEMAIDAASGQLDVIGAFYWYQGENDAMDPAQYPAYESNLTAFIGHVRADLPINPAAPIALAKESIGALIALEQFAGSCGTPNCSGLVAGDTGVRAADDQVAATVHGVVEVDTLGLPRTGLLIHLSNVGELELGKELAVATDHQFP